MWHFDESEQYDSNLKQGGLFTGYINKFLKMKTEATGFPEHVTNNEQKQNYVDAYLEREGVNLDINNIELIQE